MVSPRNRALLRRLPEWTLDFGVHRYIGAARIWIISQTGSDAGQDVDSRRRCVTALREACGGGGGGGNEWM